MSATNSSLTAAARRARTPKITRLASGDAERERGRPPPAASPMSRAATTTSANDVGRKPEPGQGGGVDDERGGHEQRPRAVTGAGGRRRRAAPARPAGEELPDAPAPSSASPAASGKMPGPGVASVSSG